MYIWYEHSMYVSHISVSWVCNMCTINESAHTKKCLETYLIILVHICNSTPPHTHMWFYTHTYVILRTHICNSMCDCVPVRRKKCVYMHPCWFTHTHTHTHTQTRTCTRTFLFYFSFFLFILWWLSMVQSCYYRWVLCLMAYKPSWVI